MSIHKPVLLNEVLGCLDPKPGQNFIDCTLGGGGHTCAILKRTGPEGKILAIDADPGALERFQVSDLRFKQRMTLVNGNFANLKKIYTQSFNLPVAGILFDLGLSSDQLEASGRGFSFQKNEPLDMRFSAIPFLGQVAESLNAGEIINSWPQAEIEKILRIYGQEPLAREIAGEIARTRKRRQIKTTFELIEIILKTKSPLGPPTKLGEAKYARHALRTNGRWQRRRIHPATKTFQALRMAVNQELESLARALPQAVDILATGGRLVVISFHGLEDRIVKRFYSEQAKADVLIRDLNRLVAPGQKELKENPRSRSAKLRLAVKT